MADSVNLTTPVGRIVQGSLYEAQVKDMDGKPLVIKSGPQAGQPTKRYYFALAIPKGQERAWWETEWGAKILSVGAASAPQSYQRPDFAWKITDGDSTAPNKQNRKPCDSEGFPRHWVLRLSSGFAPKVFSMIGVPPGGAPIPMLEVGAVQPGHYVQVNLNVAGNNDSRNPGVYLNHSMVALIGYGPVIQFGPDPASAGFGAPLPAGASAVPLAGFTPPAAPAASLGPATPAPGTYAPPPVAAPAAPQMTYQPPPAAGMPPHPAMVAAAPAPPAAPPPPAARRMTARANGAPYESFITAGWTDAVLVQHGMMEP